MSHRFTLTFLGVGAGLSPELGNNNVLLESEDRSVNLLIDCGPVTAHDLKINGRLPEIQNVFITHVHDDHVGGLQLWGQLNRYVYRQRPLLIFNEALYDELWNGSMRGGLGKINAKDHEPAMATLDDYFTPRALRDGEPVQVDGLPPLTLLQSLHVPGKLSFSFFIGEDVFYSSDTQDLPPSVGPTGKPLRAIFQDCQLFETGNDVHTPLQRLVRELSPEQKAITHLMHYNQAPDQDAKALGFAGFVKPNEPYRL